MPTTWPGSWPWCSRAWPDRRCSTPTRWSASRLPRSRSSRPTRATSRARHPISVPRTTSRRPTTSTSSWAISIARLPSWPRTATTRGHEDPRLTFGRPGSRAPHVWLHRGGNRVSTIDLFGRSFVLLSTFEGARWCASACAAASRFKTLELEAHCVGTALLRDPDLRFAEAYGLAGAGAVLVRPDGFVAWRARDLASDAEDRIEHALARALMGETGRSKA